MSFAEPGAKKGEYGAAIAALSAEMVLLSGRKIESEAAKKFIKENLHARVGGEEPIRVDINGNCGATIQAAVRRAIATFSPSKEGDLFNYLKKILLENQILVNVNRITVTYVKFSRQMTERQLKTVKDRIQEEIRLYAPDAEVEFLVFPLLQQSEEKIKNAGVGRNLTAL